MSRTLYTALAIAFGIVIFLAANILANSGLRYARFDLTANRQYTLSPGTMRLLQSIEEPITLRFFYSAKTANPYLSVRSYAQRVRDLLSEYAARARGKLILEVIDPEPFSPDEGRAEAAGISGKLTPAGDTIYFGLEGTNMADGREVIPYFSEERDAFLEYDLTSLIDKLNRLKKPVLGFISGISLEAGPGGLQAVMAGRAQPYELYRELSDKFDIKFLDTDMRRVPEDVSTLMIVQPQALAPSALYAIDQFVLGGGHALVFIDPHSEIARQGQTMSGAPPPNPSLLAPLLEAWGVTMPADKVVGDLTLSQQVLIGQGDNPRIVNYVIWLGLTNDVMDKDDPVSGEIDDLALGSAGALIEAKDATTTITPLITSTENAMLIPVDEIAYMPDPEALIRNFAPAGEPFTLAARITGMAKSAFPNGAPPPPENDEQAAEESEKPAPLPPPLTQSKGDIDVIVVADTDLFDDQFWVHRQNVMGQEIAVPVADNGDFVLNAVENLMGSNALIGLRGRAVAERRFTLVDAMRRRAEARYLAEEERLRADLAETKRRLSELQQQGGGAEGRAIIITPEQQAEIDRFRLHIAETDRALNEVQYKLRRNIDRLGAWLRIINIGLVPFLVGVVALILVIVGRRRRVRAARHAGVGRAE